MFFGSKKKNIADPNKDEQSAKKEAAIEEKKAAKEKRKKDKVGSKIEHDKSDIAKSLGIRISNPYGYYPDDVDKIIINLNDQIANLTKENLNLTKERDEIKGEYEEVKKERDSINAEFASYKLNAQFMTHSDLTFENQVVGLSKMGDINGKDYKSEVPEILSTILDEPDPLETPSEEPAKKIKLKLGGNK